MDLTQEQKAEFKELAAPLMEFMAQNCHPNSHVIVTSQTATLSEAVIGTVRMKRCKHCNAEINVDFFRSHNGYCGDCFVSASYAHHYPNQ